MKTNSLISEATISSSNRHGVTLTEVLMSLMIMSLGVGLVATLFPIAALRSAQATKMTNGAVAKLNVEALLGARPEIIFDPDGDFVNSSPSSPNRWKRVSEHFRRKSEQNYIVDPSGYFANAASFSFATISNNATTGDIDLPFDPNARGYCDYFGNFFDTTANSVAPYQVLPRFDGGLRTGALPALLGPATLQEFELLASELSTLGDGWDTVIDEVAEGFIEANGGFTATATTNIVGVRLSNELDLSSIITSAQYTTGLSIPDPEVTRITIFRADGQISQSFPLTAISGSTCVWTESAVGPIVQSDYNADGIISPRNLPIEFFGAGAGRVLIQTKRIQDFNWFLTVRRGPDGRARGVDVVVMFNNGRSPDDERVFPATFTSQQFGVVVADSSGVNSSGDPAEPFLKRGGWVLDVENARWYRIASYKENPVITGNHLVTLETAAAASSPAGGGGAIFIPGIVDVYPLGSIALPPNMTPLNF